MLETFITGIIGVIGLMIGWVLVQSLWRKVFADHLGDEDVLADRSSCGNCGCTTVCSTRRRELEELEAGN